MLIVFFEISSLQAHPHNWIELNSSFVIDENSHLIQVKQRWEFDMYYSLMTHADLLNEFGDEQKGLLATAERMIKNLKAYDYFSTLNLNGENIALGMPQEYRLNAKKKDGQIILELDMHFNIKTEINVKNKTLSWQVFDPTYYIAMRHLTKNNIKIISGEATQCTKALEFTEPSDDLIDYAQSFDRNQKNTDGLGKFFAETAIVNCH